MKHILLALFASIAIAQEKPASLLIPEARVAIIGDSITEQKLYSKYIECYLLACTGRSDIHVFQFGWSGERADGFAARAANDLAVFKPNVATTCYGMNDGSYQAFNNNIGSAYERNMRRVIAELRAAGVQKIALGSPGGVDPDFFTRPTIKGEIYNDNLARLRDIARKLASEHSLAFANVHGTMMDALPKAKAVLGKGYGPFGGDGFHPAPAGQLLMATAFLKALGLDGEIGAITLDWNSGAATASAGHEVAGGGAGNKAAGGKGVGVTLRSVKWPFCFDADAKDSNSTRSILPFCPFNEELNRLTLQVKNFPAPKAAVQWGADTKTFSREQLETGVNLAAEFPKTPFDAAFADFMGAVATKQAYETMAIKNLVTQFRSFGEDAKSDAEFAAALDVIRRKVKEKNAAHDASARKRLKPVEHQIWVSVAAQ
jgi:lysophospholipase L1-like esterase